EHDQVRYEFGNVKKVDTETREIFFKQRSTVITYDYLIIGLGCEDSYHGIEGASEFTDSVQSFSKARHAGMAIGKLYAYGMLNVVGSGVSGIEVASERMESGPS